MATWYNDRSDPAEVHGGVVAECPDGPPVIRRLDINGRYIVVQTDHRVGEIVLTSRRVRRAGPGDHGPSGQVIELVRPF
jgi:hypothetical protein